MNTEDCLKQACITTAAETKQHLATCATVICCFAIVGIVACYGFYCNTLNVKEEHTRLTPLVIERPVK